MKNIKLSQKQQGMTLIEAMIVISLAAVFLYVVMIGYPLGRDYLSQYSLTKRVTDFSIVAGQSCINNDCSNVTTARILASGNLKEYHDAGDTGVMSISGVAVEFAPANIGAGTNNGLSQTHENITQRVCNMSIKSLWNTVALVNVDGTAVKANPDDDIDEDLINANCTAGFNQIEFITQA
jgi:prepilin-type N-terminal cleavage/methylation domain-containing protein